MSGWSIPDIFGAWDKGGPFVAGTVFGAIITLLILKLVSGERRLRMQLDAKYAAEVQKQLHTKDMRINMLQNQIGEGQKRVGTYLEQISEAQKRYEQLIAKYEKSAKKETK